MENEKLSLSYVIGLDGTLESIRPKLQVVVSFATFVIPLDIATKEIDPGNQGTWLTACCISILRKGKIIQNKRSWGKAILNPKDEFDQIIGRHKAFRGALKQFIRRGYWIRMSSRMNNWDNEDSHLIFTILKQYMWDQYLTCEISELVGFGVEEPNLFLQMLSDGVLDPEKYNTEDLRSKLKSFLKEMKTKYTKPMAIIPKPIYEKPLVSGMPEAKILIEVDFAKVEQKMLSFLSEEAKDDLVNNRPVFHPETKEIDLD